MRRQVQVVEPLNFLRMLESEIVEALLLRYAVVMSRNDVVEVREFVGALMAIQLKAKELMLENAVKDKVMMMLPFLEREVEEPREGLPSLEEL